MRIFINFMLVTAKSLFACIDCNIYSYMLSTLIVAGWRVGLEVDRKIRRANNRGSCTFPGRSCIPITAYDARHDALQRLQGSRFTASALFQSAALLLPDELKLLGSFMRLIPPSTWLKVTSRLRPPLFLQRKKYTDPSFLSYFTALAK